MVIYYKKVTSNQILAYFDSNHETCQTNRKLECGPMPNVMAAQPNITFQICILNSHHIMCGSMVDIQSTTAEIRRGRKKVEERKNRTKI